MKDDTKFLLGHLAVVIPFTKNHSMDNSREEADLKIL